MLTSVSHVAPAISHRRHVARVPRCIGRVQLRAKATLTMDGSAKARDAKAVMQVLAPSLYSFNVAKALQMARLAAQAYETPEATTPYPGTLFGAPPSLKIESLGTNVASAAPGYTPVVFMDSSEDTQLWVYTNTEKQEIVISFRGTTPTEWQDDVTDLRLAPAHLDRGVFQKVDTDPDAAIGWWAQTVATVVGLAAAATTTVDGAFRAASIIIRTKGGMLGVEIFRIMVHRGFLAGYQSVDNPLRDLVLKLTAQVAGSWTVTVTGHSLGGALATLAAYDLATDDLTKGHDIKMITFGGPRVGNTAFVRAFNGVVPDAWRVTNERDLVTEVPSLGGFYLHVGRQAVLNDEGLEASGMRESDLALNFKTRSKDHWARFWQNNIKDHGMSEVYIPRLEEALQDEEERALEGASAGSRGSSGQQGRDKTAAAA